ncbi:MAG: hypothetical protein ACRCUM_03125 [Mycoplasmoidaceae bacterium]
MKKRCKIRCWPIKTITDNLKFTDADDKEISGDVIESVTFKDGITITASQPIEGIVLNVNLKSGYAPAIIELEVGSLGTASDDVTPYFFHLKIH